MSISTHGTFKGQELLDRQVHVQPVCMLCIVLLAISQAEGCASVFMKCRETTGARQGSCMCSRFEVVRDTVAEALGRDRELFRQCVNVV